LLGYKDYVLGGVNLEEHISNTRVSVFFLKQFTNFRSTKINITKAYKRYAKLTLLLFDYYAPIYIWVFQYISFPQHCLYSFSLSNLPSAHLNNTF